jgi:hypothetical protein
MNNTNSPMAEINLLILSVAIIAAMTVLFVLGKIDYVEAIPFLTVVAGLYGVNTALKAPSPTQQAQLNVQQQGLQQVISQVMNVLPALFQAHSHPVPTTPTVQPAPAPLPTPVAPQAVQQQPFPPQVLPPVYTPPPAVARSFGDTSSMPTVQP